MTSTVADRVKVLFVVTEFWNAGTQRFTYEVDRALNKDQFQVTILSFRDLGTDPQRPDHYHPLHRALGTEIRFLSEFKDSMVGNFLRKIGIPWWSELNKFMDSFDAISFMGEYAYMRFDRQLEASVKRKSVIHIMNSRFQAPFIYDRYDYSEKYRFCSGFSESEIVGELENFKDYTHCFMPLSLNIDRTEPRWEPILSGPMKVGIFTRITPTKPLEPFLTAFQGLQQIVPTAELHIFGYGDPETVGYLELVRQLGIVGNVHFRGHRDDMLGSALQERLSLVWFHSFYGVPGGFAGFDIATLGIPQLFWNFTPETAFTPDPAFPVFNDPQSFINTSLKVLQDENHASELSRVQFNAICKTRDIRKHIHRLESLYRQMTLNENESV